MHYLPIKCLKKNFFRDDFLTKAIDNCFTLQTVNLYICKMLKVKNEN